MEAFLAVEWSTSDHYRGRTHLVLKGQNKALCGLRIHELYDVRPAGLLVCPECALSFTILLFPNEIDYR